MTTPQAREALYAAMRKTFGPDQADKLEMARIEGERMNAVFAEARQERLHPAILAMEKEVDRNAVREQRFWDEVNEEAASFEY